jgi:hypothetical protein
MSYECIGEGAAFVDTCGNSGGYRGGRGGHGFRCGHDSQGGGRLGSREPHKCTHCGCSNHSMDFCWDLRGKPSGFANQAFSLEDSLAIFCTTY